MLFQWACLFLCASVCLFLALSYFSLSLCIYVYILIYPSPSPSEKTWITFQIDLFSHDNDLDHRVKDPQLKLCGQNCYQRIYWKPSGHNCAPVSCPYVVKMKLISHTFRVIVRTKMTDRTDRLSGGDENNTPLAEGQSIDFNFVWPIWKI